MSCKKPTQRSSIFLARGISSSFDAIGPFFVSFFFSLLMYQRLAFVVLIVLMQAILFLFVPFFVTRMTPS